MPISFGCDHCGRSLNVRDDLAGADIYCPDCRAILTVPGGEVEDDSTDWDERDSASAEFADHAAQPNGPFDERGMPVSSATAAEEDPRSDVVPPVRPAVTVEEKSKPRPLLILGGMVLMGAAGLAIMFMVLTGKVRPGLVKVMVFLGVFGLATLLRGLGNKQPY